MENLKMGSKSLLVMLRNIHDSHGTVSNSFGPYLRDLLLKIWEIYKKCSNSVNFWARKMFFFFKWVRISPEIDWYHYQCASPAPTCIVRHQTMIKAPTSKVSHQSPVCPPSPVVIRVKTTSRIISTLLPWILQDYLKNTSGLLHDYSFWLLNHIFFAEILNKFVWCFINFQCILYIFNIKGQKT